MYDELIKKIRHCATDPMHCLSCGEDKDGRCFKRLMTQAADAIEDLSATISKMEKATQWMPLHEPQKELIGTDMRGGIRRDDAGNVVDWGITGPPGDVGKTEEGET